MKLLNVYIASILGLALTASAADLSLGVNRDFESGDLTGWTTIGRAAVQDTSLADRDKVGTKAGVATASASRGAPSLSELSKADADLVTFIASWTSSKPIQTISLFQQQVTVTSPTDVIFTAAWLREAIGGNSYARVFAYHPLTGQKLSGPAGYSSTSSYRDTLLPLVYTPYNSELSEYLAGDWIVGAYILTYGDPSADKPASVALGDVKFRSRSGVSISEPGGGRIVGGSIGAAVILALFAARRFRYVL